MHWCSKQFRAHIAAPKGRNDFISSNIPIPPVIEMLRQNKNDDNFFHITCHIDENLKAKIKCGEFVDLETFIAKDNSTKVITDESFCFYLLALVLASFAILDPYPSIVLLSLPAM